MKSRYFKIIAYRLADGETVISLRQMALTVRHAPQTAKEFIRKKGVKPWKVRMPNRNVAEAIPLSLAVAYWKYLEESGKGNQFTKLGQQLISD